MADWFRIASRLGMPVAECQTRLSYREYLLWQGWFDVEWDNPSLTDFYLMQLACEVRRSYVRNPRSVKPDDFLLKFGRVLRPQTDQTSPNGMTREQAATISKTAWLGRMTMPVKVIEVQPDHGPLLPPSEPTVHR